MKFLKPERICDSFVLQRVGDTTAAPEGTTRLWFSPRLVFGVGSHPTTQLAAQALQDALRTRPGQTVLDVGTGTGVLAMVAAKLGAARVVGLDILPEAVQAARENAIENDVADVCSFSTAAVGSISERFELVVRQCGSRRTGMPGKASQQGSRPHAPGHGDFERAPW